MRGRFVQQSLGKAVGKPSVGVDPKEILLGHVLLHAEVYRRRLKPLRIERQLDNIVQISDGFHDLNGSVGAPAVDDDDCTVDRPRLPPQVLEGFGDDGCFKCGNTRVA